MTTSAKATLNRVGDLGINLLRIVSGALLSGLMLLTAVDVIMRYALNSPIRGSFEIAELLVALLMFSGVPLVSFNNQHVCIDLLDRLFSPWVSRLVDLCASLICVAIFAFMGLLLLRKISLMTMTGDVTSALNIPILPFVSVMFGFALLTALVHLIKFLAICSGAPAVNGPSSPTGGSVA